MRAGPRYGQLPIHNALSHKRWEVAVALVEWNEFSTKQPDDSGKLPLQIALSHQAPLETINVLAHAPRPPPPLR